ncbi:MAG: NAD-dependent epimerase/dehydratase family protein [Deltaproteobacteria bacterium]|nr:MAG: NAD-dependent epimerase/dehydratase family protein [Deltaproteobacteria bacterium]TMQ12822.1 MAG: NAD-dependent epimerase/dehydratase family protein [Deltaproteobacteria bacterium]
MSNLRRTLSRRDVLRGALAGAVLGVPLAACMRPQPGPAPRAPVASKKKILILGGTGFLGPKTVASAVARGHEVTIFNRGRREKLLPLEVKVEHLYGNRDPDLPADDERGPDGKLLHPDAQPRGLGQLAGRRWDVVIDNSGFYPRMVGASAKLLDKAELYIYISSISAYADDQPPGSDETAPLATLADPKVETMGKDFENYGGLKALCERAASEALPGRTAIVRPGYIVGPGDPTDRFTYWPVRIARGGDVLAPGAPDDPLQWIDVRDLADWLVTLAEHGTAGTFNAIGPPSPARWGDVLGACVDASGGAAKLVWVPAAWLEQNGMGGEDAFPIWVPPTGKFAGFHRWNNDRAEAAGLTFRPVADTVKAILAWYPGEVDRRVRVTRELVEAAKAKGQEPPRGDPSALRAGPSRQQEEEMLAKWKASNG